MKPSHDQKLSSCEQVAMVVKSNGAGAVRVRATGDLNRKKLGVKSVLSFCGSLEQKEVTAELESFGAAVAIAGKDYQGVPAMAATQRCFRKVHLLWLGYPAPHGR